MTPAGVTPFRFAGAERVWALPPELLRLARRRVTYLTAFFVVMGLVSVVAIFLRPSHPYTLLTYSPLHVVLPLLLLGAGLLAASRSGAVQTQTLLRMTFVFQLIVALSLSVLRHGEPWPEGQYRDWSAVSAWILIFAAVIPQTPARAAAAALLSAATDPLGLAIGVAAGNPWPSTHVTAQLLAPTLGAAVVAIVISRIIYSLGRQVSEARQLGSYRLVERLGAGGMGEVWRAEHQRLAHPAAVKLIPAEVMSRLDESDQRRMRLRFEREAKATAMLESEHTVRLFDYGVTRQGTYFYVMEYLDGLDLQQMVERFGALRPERVVHLLLQVCDSLEEAHQSMLIHRDIKPANIYVCRRGLREDVVKVVDFGLVKPVREARQEDVQLTHDGCISGTPAFIAPEAALGNDRLDHRADIYSLGCVAYYLLTGRIVFEADSAVGMLLAHIQNSPGRVSTWAEAPIPAELEQLVQDCLRKDPDDRPANIAEVRQRLERVSSEAKWGRQEAAQWWQRYDPRPRPADECYTSSCL